MLDQQIILLTELNNIIMEKIFLQKHIDHGF